MTRALVTVPADQPGVLLRALHLALTGDGPAVLPRALRAPGAAPPLPTSVAQDVALVIETSGSTGVPKRVVLSRDALLASAAASAGALGGDGQWLLCLPGHYVAGSNVLVRSIVAGTTPVVLGDGHFDPRAFGDAAASMTGDGRFVSLVPVQLARLVETASDPATGDPRLLEVLRRFDGVLVGGQALRPALRDRAVDLGLKLTRTYGSSETGGGCVYNGIPIGTTRPREVGGLLELAGPVLADGYLDDPARTDAAFHIEDGIRWYRTGDLGAVEAGGRVTVHGRADNVIVSGGEKVLLDAVERRVREAPGFGAAVVVAADSAEWGQVPVVVVERVAALDGSLPLAALREHVVTALGRAAAPARIVVVEQIPRLASGKPDRQALARIVGTQAP
ncbi:AMP-binding protein [Rathayibacter soli]|uniref:AMP-binding protein n=1 Tax=Rathayibacter soli TaxID=3144168 RepID=UPI0027E539A7|nr:AMP-binding protein [Glaciibacter superstes]